MTAVAAPSRVLSKARSPLNQPRMPKKALRSDWAMSNSTEVVPSGLSTGPPLAMTSAMVCVTPASVTVRVGVPVRVWPSPIWSRTTSSPSPKKSMP
ncbi:hypothetical protein D3C81_1533740 [compost metagenome]